MGQKGSKTLQKQAFLPLFGVRNHPQVPIQGGRVPILSKHPVCAFFLYDNDWNRILGRGRDEAEISEEEAPFSLNHSKAFSNEGFGEELYRHGKSVKRFWPFNGSPDFN